MSLAGSGSSLGLSQPCLAVFFRMLAELPSPGKTHWRTTRKIRSRKLYDTKVLPLSLSGVGAPGCVGSWDSAFREPDVSRDSRSASACSVRSPEQTWSPLLPLPGVQSSLCALCPFLLSVCIHLQQLSCGMLPKQQLGGITGGIIGGIIRGIIGGIIGKITGGITGGIRGGTTGGIIGKITGTITGGIIRGIIGGIIGKITGGIIGRIPGAIPGGIPGGISGAIPGAISGSASAARPGQCFFNHEPERITLAPCGSQR